MGIPYIQGKIFIGISDLLDYCSAFTGQLMAKTLISLSSVLEIYWKRPFCAVTTMLFQLSSLLFPNREHHFEAVMHFYFQSG